MRGWRALQIASGVLCLLGIRSAQAAPSTLEVRAACTPKGVDGPSLEAALAVEFARTSTAIRPTRAVLSPEPCPSAAFLLELAKAAGSTFIAISLMDVPLEARARTIAIIVGERLSHAVEAEDRPQPEQAEERAEPSRLLAPAGDARQLGIFAAASVRYLFRYQRALFGGCAGLSIEVFEFARAEVEANVSYGRAAHVLGEGRTLLAAAGGALLLETSAGQLRFGGGPAIELGVAVSSGHTSQSGVLARQSVDAVFLLGLTGFVAVDFDLAEVFLRLDLEAALRGQDGLAEGDHLIGVSGVLGGLSLGARFEL